MNKQQKTFTVLLAVTFVVACLGLKYGGASVTNQYLTTAGTAGDTNSTFRIAQISADFTTTTPASLLNNDSRDRIISNVEIYTANTGNFTSVGTGLTSTGLLFKMSTSTNPYTADASNFVWNSSYATATGPIIFTSSSSPGTIGLGTSPATSTRVWASGTYLNLFVNGTTSATSGFVKVNYAAAP